MRSFVRSANLASFTDSRFTIHEMYRRPKFLEVLLDIRREMAHEVDYDTDLFAEMIRSGRHTTPTRSHSMVLETEKPSPHRDKAGTKKRLA